MMVVRQTPAEHIFAAALAGPSGRKNWSGATWAAVGFTVIVHLALGLYLYRLHVSMGPSPTQDDPIMTVSRVELTPPPPPTAPTPQPRQRVISLHHPVMVDQAAAPTLPQLTETPAWPVDQPTTLQTETVAPPPQAPRLIGEPNWLRRPDSEALTKYYPRRAMDHDIEGSATLACIVTANGRLDSCRVADESPAGAGFGAAALKLAALFQMSPRTIDGQPVDGGVIRIPIRFNLGRD